MNGRKDEKEERRMGQREVGTGEGQGGGEGGKRDGGSVGRKSVWLWEGLRCPLKKM